jgi:hypothetical protein
MHGCSRPDAGSAVVGGYALIQTKTHEEAIEVATRFMELHRIHWPNFDGECEVRPLQEM